MFQNIKKKKKKLIFLRSCTSYPTVIFFFFKNISAKSKKKKKNLFKICNGFKIKKIIKWYCGLSDTTRAERPNSSNNYLVFFFIVHDEVC